LARRCMITLTLGSQPSIMLPVGGQAKIEWWLRSSPRVHRAQEPTWQSFPSPQMYSEKGHLSWGWEHLWKTQRSQASLHCPLTAVPPLAPLAMEQVVLSIGDSSATPERQCWLTTTGRTSQVFHFADEASPRRFSTV
jgi:hypothetical protein